MQKKPSVVQLTLAFSIVLATVGVSHAQWLKVSTPGVPRSAEGKPMRSAPAPRATHGHPDLSGIWLVASNKYLPNIAADGVVVPMQPWAAEHSRQFLERNSLGLLPDGRPMTCMPHGTVFGMVLANNPFKIVQTPNLTVVMFEQMNQYRQIHTDGRSLPENQEPTWYGYSVGHWDADRFIVDTKGFNGRMPLDNSGHPVTESLHLTERYHRVNFGHMDVEFTFDDPKAYTRPWSVTLPYELMADTELIEYVCENEKDASHLVGK